jgi:hypothetical protein
MFHQQASRSTTVANQTIPLNHKDERHVAILDRKSQLVSWERGQSRPHQRRRRSSLDAAHDSQRLFALRALSDQLLLIARS